MSKQSKPNEQPTPGDPSYSDSQNNANEQPHSDAQLKPNGQDKVGQPRTPGGQKKSRRKRKRRSRYKKLSDKVFKSTGMPLSRLLSIVTGILLIAGLIFYIRFQGDESLPSSIEVPSSQFESGESEEQDYLAAVTIPADFAQSSLPVRIDKVDWMIERCTYLLNQKNNYSEKIEEKMLSLLALKAVIMAESGLDPAQHLDLLKKRVAQSSGSLGQIDKHQYLLVVTYMTSLASAPEAEIYDGAVETIRAIQDTTPVPPATAIACYNACLKYYVNSADKAAAAKLLQLMGEKLAISEKQRLSDLGLTLIDYPNFSYYYQDSFIQPKSGSKFESETLQLLRQIQETPPQSVKTYDLLLTVPEQYLQSGNAQVALKILDQFSSIASQSNAKIRDNVLEKVERLTKRINLLGRKFSIEGVDVTGANIKPLKKEKTVVIFWDPDVEESQEALVRVADSRLFDRWSTAVFLASVSELTVKEIAALKRRYPNFKVVDGPTAIQWIEKSGVNEVPYLLVLDQEGIVRRLSTP